jgi:flagellar hook protein FlgE
MINAYNSALSALKTFETKLESNGNNIANSNTNGFKRTRVTNSAVKPAGVQAHIQKIDSPGTKVFEETADMPELVELSNVDLASELVDMTLNSHFYKANLKTIETVNEMTSELLDLKA